MRVIPEETVNTPKHIAIIMDGNGRWAQKRFLPRTAGHVKGASGVKRLIQACADKGIECVTLFAFSTENWKRPVDEVNTLMKLFIQYLEGEMQAMSEAGVRLKVIGDIEGFTPELRDKIYATQQKTANNNKITLAVAANYGGRWDIVQAAQKWMQAHQGSDFDPKALNEDVLDQYLSTGDMPALDLLIRTGGERRISNFLLWQAAYAELYFSDALWPDFDEAELDKALQWFAQSDRRFGTVKNV
jgi:undecaprenyl diphosphate synthase